MIREIMSALERGAAMRALYKQGHATSQQILELEYGVWPPKGVNHTDDNKLNTQVQLKSVFKDKEAGLLTKVFTGLMALGYVHGKEQIAGSEMEKAPTDQTIYMNPILMGPAGRVGAALITKSLVTSFVANLTLAGVGAFLMGHKLLTATALFTSLRLLPLVQLVTMPFRPFSDVVGHEHVHILQIHDKERANTGYAMDDNNFKDEIKDRHRSYTGLKQIAKFADNVLSLGVSSYLLNDVEIQARMHTLMVHGYRRWERLPETPTELKAAMLDCGMNAPREVWDEVRNSKEEGVKDFITPGLTGVFARAARKSFGVDTAELNAAQRAIGDKDLKSAFWEETAPFMYGHLLELYGDEGGLQKMDVTRGDYHFNSVDEDEEIALLPPVAGPWGPRPAAQPVHAMA